MPATTSFAAETLSFQAAAGHVGIGQQAEPGLLGGGGLEAVRRRALRWSSPVERDVQFGLVAAAPRRPFGIISAC